MCLTTVNSSSQKWRVYIPLGAILFWGCASDSLCTLYLPACKVELSYAIQVSVAVSLVRWTLLFSFACWFILPETDCSNFILPKTDHYNTILFPNDYCNHRNVITVKSLCSDAHGCQSPVTDQLKSQKTDCSNPHQDLGPIKMLFWSPRVPFFFYDAADKLAIAFPPLFKPQVSSKHRHADKSIRIAGAPCFGWS